MRDMHSRDYTLNEMRRTGVPKQAHLICHSRGPRQKRRAPQRYVDVRGYAMNPPKRGFANPGAYSMRCLGGPASEREGYL